MNKGPSNTRLFRKMSAAQDKYRDWLLEQPPMEILSHAYEYSVREDLLLMMENKELTEAQAKALLRSPAPLEDVYKAWEKQDTRYMEDLWATMENRADEVIQREKQKSHSKGAR